MANKEKNTDVDKNGLCCLVCLFAYLPKSDIEVDYKISEMQKLNLLTHKR